jgi:hypothetical protein
MDFPNDCLFNIIKFVNDVKTLVIIQQLSKFCRYGYNDKENHEEINMPFDECWKHLCMIKWDLKGIYLDPDTDFFHAPTKFYTYYKLRYCNEIQEYKKYINPVYIYPTSNKITYDNDNNNDNDNDLFTVYKYISPYKDHFIYNISVFSDIYPIYAHYQLDKTNENVEKKGKYSNIRKYILHFNLITYSENKDKFTITPMFKYITYPDFKDDMEYKLDNIFKKSLFSYNDKLEKVYNNESFHEFMIDYYFNNLFLFEFQNIFDSSNYIDIIDGDEYIQYTYLGMIAKLFNISHIIEAHFNLPNAGMDNYSYDNYDYKQLKIQNDKLHKVS